MTADSNSPTNSTRIRIEGTVTAVHADGRFTLALTGDTDRTGTASGSQLRRLGSLIGCRALVLGSAGAGGILIVDGALPATPSTDPGYQFSVSELDVMFANPQAAVGTRPEATDEEMDALLKSDR